NVTPKAGSLRPFELYRRHHTITPESAAGPRGEPGFPPRLPSVVVFLSSAPDLEVVGWPFDPTVYAGLVALFLGHAWLARGRNLPKVRSLYLGLGLICLWVALETPIDTISDHYLDSVHMVQHVL